MLERERGGGGGGGGGVKAGRKEGGRGKSETEGDGKWTDGENIDHNHYNVCIQ